METNTFSAAVESVIARSGRGDMRKNIEAYVLLTIRECQSLSDFASDLVETQITATASPFTWDMPSYFNKMLAVRYQIVNLVGEYIYPKMLKPGMSHNEFDYYYYYADNYIAFAGVSTGGVIDVAYYTYAKRLQYYEVADRPAIYDLETESWTYKNAVTDADKEQARGKVTNWLLFKYFDTICEGALAKILKMIGDPRASSSFAFYKSLQDDILRKEV